MSDQVAIAGAAHHMPLASIGSLVLRRIRKGGLGVVPVTAIATVWIVMLALLRANPRTTGFVDQVSGLRTDQSWSGWLIRLPGASFAPAPRLPVWGAVLQVVFVGVIAETVLGRRRMVVAAVTATVAVSLLGRLMTEAGAGSGAIAAAGRDTGPSVAVAALAVGLAVAVRKPVLAAAVAAPLFLYELLAPSLAGFEHVAAVVLGAAFGMIWSHEISLPEEPPQVHRPALLRTRWMAAAVVGAAGVVNIARTIEPWSAVSGPGEAIDTLPFTVGVRHTEFAIVVGILLLLLARGLRRGQSVAWSVAVVAAVVRLSVAPQTVTDTVELLLIAAFAIVLLGSRRAFRAPGRFGVARRSRQVAVAIGLTATGVVALAARSVARGEHNVPFSHRIVSVLHRVPAPLDRRVGDWFELVATVLIGAALWLVTRPALCPLASDPVSRGRARRCVELWGADTLSFFALRDDKAVFFHGESLVAYTVRGAVAVVSPDPIGPPADREATWAAFREYAQGNGWSIVVLGAGGDWLQTYLADDLRVVYIGDEAIVDVTEFSLAGGRKSGLRHAASRVARNGYTATFHDPSMISADLATDLRALMSKSRRGDAERGFSMTLGRFFDPDDTGMLLAVCRDADDRPVAFCTFVPAPDIGGWSLDAMRRDCGEHPNGLLDFLLVETIAHVKANGASAICLNFATMRSIVADDSVTGVGRRVTRWLLHKGSESMQIESLWRYNAKFGPTWSARYAVFEQLTHVPDGLVAIARVESIWELPVIGRLMRRTGGSTSETVAALDGARQTDAVDAR